MYVNILVMWCVNELIKVTSYIKFCFFKCRQASSEKMYFLYGLYRQFGG